LRRRAPAGQGLANDGRGSHSVFGLNAVSGCLRRGIMTDPIIWQSGLPVLLAALAFGYLLGSIPFGLLITRAAGMGDVRKIGSGNIGATNVLRTGNKGLAALTLLLDALKGTVAVLVAGRWGGDLAIVAGFGAFIGHLFPVWLGFKGGKGVATYLGVLIGLAW